LQRCRIEDASDGVLHFKRVTHAENAQPGDSLSLKFHRIGENFKGAGWSDQDHVRLEISRKFGVKFL
jgi:hypothetical protein